MIGDHVKRIAIATTALLVLPTTALAANFLLTKTAETNSTVTFTYPQQPGDGYRYYAPGQISGQSCSGTRVSRTLDPTRTSIKFSKVISGTYCVEAVVLTAVGAAQYPQATPPPAPDTEPPEKPMLSLGKITKTSVVLSWQAGVDNFGVDHYNVWLGDKKITETKQLSYTYMELTCDTNYLLGLEAVDAAGNKSVLGEARWGVTTESCTEPPPPPTPPPGGYPDASTTGVPAGVELTTYTGPANITVAGAVIDAKAIDSCLTVSAPNVTIKRSRVSCSGGSVIWNDSTGLIVEDTDLLCGGRPGTTALTPSNYTARRIDASNCENTLWANANVTIEDSYIHDPIPYDSVTDPHTDSVQGIQTNILIRHNRIYGGYVGGGNFGNSAVTLGGVNSCCPYSNVVIDDNVLAGGGYTLYCPQPGDAGSSSAQVHITNNRFSTVYTEKVGGFGPVIDCADEPNFIGNVYHETGIPVPSG